MATKKSIALMVTTSDRGVFFGYGHKTIERHIELTQVRNCLQWSADMRGVWGLAVVGPSSTCKVGMAVPKMTLHNITALVEVSAEAVAKWESAPWS